MSDKKKKPGDKPEPASEQPVGPVIRDKRRVDPETGDVRDAAAGDSTADASAAPAGAAAAGVEGNTAGGGNTDETDGLSSADEALLDQAAIDLVADMRSDMLRAQAELVNFRTRVERDRAANRDAVIAEVIRSLLPALDDLARAEAHGDLEGSPFALVAQKLHAGFEKFGLRQIGEKGEVFDPTLHQAVVQLPSAEVTVQTVADVIESGYALGDRLVRPAKVAVSVPAE